MSKKNIAIVGAGPVGLSIAWLLAEKGVPVTLLEKTPSVQKDYRASKIGRAHV